MNTHFEYVVIGAGAAGAATTLELARRKKRVLLIEQFSIAHDMGSSHGHSRIFRFAYDTPHYARMAVAARELWADLEKESGMKLIHETGGLDFGPSNANSLESTRRTLQEIGAPATEFSAEELMQRYPQWQIPKDWLGLYSKDTGIVNPSQTVELMVALAKTQGAEILERLAVKKIDVEKLEVHTSKQIFSADHIVVTAGAWLAQLLPELKLPLQVTEECSVYFKPKDPKDFLPERFPVFIDHDSLAYGFPIFGLPGIKIGFHHKGKSISLQERTFEPTAEYVEHLRQWVKDFLPNAHAEILQVKTCLYTNTPSQDFLIDTHPANPNLIVASPCSGHGFKFAPLLGQMIADMTEQKHHALWQPRFSLKEILLGNAGPAI